MDNWDVTLLIVMGYLAVVALVRLMNRQRDQMLKDAYEQIKKAKIRKQREKQREKEEEWEKSA
jgi:hypothetical protein